MKRARESTEAENSATALPRIFAMAIDYSVDAEGKPTIYEIQQLRSSVTSELSKFSHTRAAKKQEEVLARLGIEGDFDEFSLDSLGKLDQRELLKRRGLQEYQPRFTCFNPQEASAVTHKDLADFLAAHPDIQNFVLKKNLASRGDGNFFLSRNRLEKYINGTSPDGKTLHDLEIESTASIHNRYTGTSTITKVHKKIEEIWDNFVIEEFRNPQTATADPKTLRSYIVFNPDSKDFQCQTLRIYHHSPNSPDSHSYKYAGTEDDFADGYHFEFNQKAIVGMEKIEKPEENPVTREHLKRIVTTAFDLSHLPAKFQSTERVAFASKKPSHTIDKHHYANATRRLLRIIPPHESEAARILRSKPGKILQLVQKDSVEFEDFLEDVAKTNPLGLSKEADEEIKDWGISVIKTYLPFFQIESFRNAFARVSVENPDLYYIKKMLGFVLIGDLDKTTEEDERYTVYKERFDRFLAMPIKPEEIAAYLKEPKPLFVKRATEEVAPPTTSTPLSSIIPLQDEQKIPIKTTTI